MTAQTRCLILAYRKWIGILTKSRDAIPNNRKRVQWHNKSIKFAQKQIKELEAQ